MSFVEIQFESSLCLTNFLPLVLHINLAELGTKILLAPGFCRDHVDNNLSYIHRMKTDSLSTMDDLIDR
jgi:hypothetical protein